MSVALPQFREHSHPKAFQNELAKKMNTLLDYLYNSVAPASVKEAAKYVCEELAAEKEISQEGE